MKQYNFDFRVANIRETETAITPSQYKQFHNLEGEGEGEGKTVVINDSGVDRTKPIFDGIEVERVDVNNFGDDVLDNVGHGTACAGMVAEIAPKIDKIIDLPIFSARGTTGMQNIGNSYDWLLNNQDKYDVVNMSWGGQTNIPQLNEMHNALAKNKPVMVAAGNSGGDGGSPATALGAFSVGACTLGGKMARFSSDNPNRENPDITALGKNMQLVRARNGSIGTPIGNGYIQASGTSFAAPILTGAYAKADSMYPEYDLESKFTKSAVNIKETPRDGAGYLNYSDSFEAEQEEQEEIPDWFRNLLEDILEGK